MSVGEQVMNQAETSSENPRLNKAVLKAEELSSLHFSVYLGSLDGDPRAEAERLHAQLVDPQNSVLVFCDPKARALEIVTGERARRVLRDGDCQLAAANMQANFSVGDLIGGLAHGIMQLGEYARRPRTLHITEDE